MNYSVRGGAGIGFKTKSITNKSYWSQFFFDWLFFFTIILVMLNIINGIIVDTFQALREQNNEKEEVRENVCYICSIKRSKFEVKGLNFSDHQTYEHNILNYFHYIIKIQKTDEHDLNSMDFQVLNFIRDSRTDFFPVKKALSLNKN